MNNGRQGRNEEVAKEVRRETREDGGCRRLIQRWWRFAVEGRGEGEEAGGYEVFLSQMRSDLFCLSLARPTGARRGLSVDFTISTLAARCWYSKTL